MTENYAPWDEVMEDALNRTHNKFFIQGVDRDTFLDTFRDEYQKLMGETTITSWPFDPPGSHRVAMHRATNFWAVNYSGRKD